jgi:hypothetical protein
MKTFNTLEDIFSSSIEQRIDLIIHILEQINREGLNGDSFNKAQFSSWVCKKIRSFDKKLKALRKIP